MGIRRWIVGIFAGCVVLTGCSGVTDLGAVVITPNSEALAGLDSNVTTEMLANPIAVRRLRDEQGRAAKESLAQGMAINFTVCRDVLRVYEEWLKSGTPPELGPLPEPNSPRQPAMQNWNDAYLDLQERMASGDPDRLKEFLTGEGSCGEWIPATPGVGSGPTIEEVVRKL